MLPVHLFPRVSVANLPEILLGNWRSVRVVSRIDHGGEQLQPCSRVSALECTTSRETRRGSISAGGSRSTAVTVRVFDFFSGCGGASCGFREAGMDIAFALDFDKDAKRTFEANFPETHFELTDIREIEAHQVRSRVEAERPNPVLFCGCAPCQPFTKQNTTRPDLNADERAPLLEHFADLVELCQPDLVFVENVPGLQKLERRSELFGSFLNRLDAAGYDVDFKPAMLARYGVPQSRRRLVLVASRHGPIRLPDETHGPESPTMEYDTVRGWIGHLPPIEAGEEHAQVPNHLAAHLSGLNLQRVMSTPEGGGHRDWPEHLKLDCHKGFSGYSDVYGRMSWDQPASGLTTRCTSYSNGRFGHPEQHRAISVREAACLQTFPEDFVFKGGLTAMSRQIGNAVPVRLARLVGEHFIEHLRGAGRLS